jgi:hypothetical protein
MLAIEVSFTIGVGVLDEEVVVELVLLVLELLSELELLELELLLEFDELELELLELLLPAR